MLKIQVSQDAVWVASLYFFQSIPFVVVSLIGAILYQQQGMTNVSIALLTSLLTLPWVLKPLVAPFFESIATKKRATLCLQALLTLAFILLAVSLHHFFYLGLTIVGFVVIAILSSIHDIVSDGLYLKNLDDKKQKKYVALRTLFYQLGTMSVKGGLLVGIGAFTFNAKESPWIIFFYSLSVISFILLIFHKVTIPESEGRSIQLKTEYSVVLKNVALLPHFYSILAFIFLYNFTEAQMQKIVPLFLLDKTGLNLSLTEVGQLFGMAGGTAFIVGVFSAVFLMAYFSIHHCLQYFTYVLLLGHAGFLMLAFAKPSYGFIFLLVTGAQFAAGLVNATYMGYLLFVANQSRYPMSMYTICTSIMASSYLLFGAFSGFVEQQLGYAQYFMAIVLANLFLVLITHYMMKKNA